SSRSALWSTSERTAGCCAATALHRSMKDMFATARSTGRLRSIWETLGERDATGRRPHEPSLAVRDVRRAISALDRAAGGLPDLPRRASIPGSPWARVDEP